MCVWLRVWLIIHGLILAQNMGQNGGVLVYLFDVRCLTTKKEKKLKVQTSHRSRTQADCFAKENL